MQWWEALGVLGEVLTIAGLVFTIYEVMKTRSTTHAVRDALERHQAETRREEALGHLQALAPIPRLIRQVMRSANRLGKLDEHLDSWMQHGTSASWHHERLQAVTPLPDKLVQLLTESLESTRQARARTRMLSRTADQGEIVELIEQAVLDMEKVVDHLPSAIEEERKFKAAPPA
jgi:hypothetical protein